MKRTFVSMCIVLTVLIVSTPSLAQPADRAARASRDENIASAPTGRESTGERQGAEQAQQVQRLQQQVEEMKAAHQSLIDRLNVIRATATKEKAAQTVKQIDTLITRQQATFQETLRPVEQQLQQLQGTVRNRPARPDQAGPHVRLAPEFEMSAFDGRKVKLSEYKGQIVVLEWLNPECPYTKFHYEKAKTMLNTAKKYRNKGVVWLAVNSSMKTTPETNRDFAAKYKLPYPIIDDRSGDLARQYGARMTPHLFIIDKEGRIAYDGAIDNAPQDKKEPSAGKINYVDKALAELTANRKVSVPNTAPYGSPLRPGR